MEVTVPIKLTARDNCLAIRQPLATTTIEHPTHGALEIEVSANLSGHVHVMVSPKGNGKGWRLFTVDYDSLLRGVVATLDTLPPIAKSGELS